MIIYGVNFAMCSNFKTEEEIMKSLGKLREIDSNLIDSCLEDIRLGKEDDPGYSFKEWVSYYEYSSGYGIAAFIRDLINTAYDIDITVEYQVLGIEEDLPWNFNQKTITLTIDDFHQILAKYTSMFIAEPMEIKPWKLCSNDEI